MWCTALSIMGAAAADAFATLGGGRKQPNQLGSTTKTAWFNNKDKLPLHRPIVLSHMGKVLRV
jgi:hypothetical protein